MFAADKYAQEEKQSGLPTGYVFCGVPRYWRICCIALAAYPYEGAELDFCRIYFIAGDYFVADSVVGVFVIPFISDEFGGGHVFGNASGAVPAALLQFGDGIRLRRFLGGCNCLFLGGIRSFVLRRGCSLDDRFRWRGIALVLPRSAVRADHGIGFSIEDSLKFAVADGEASRRGIRVARNARLQSEYAPYRRHCEEHSATLSAAVFFLLPLVGGTVGDIRMTDDFVVG